MNLEKKQKLNDDIRDSQPMSWTKIKTLGSSPDTDIHPGMSLLLKNPQVVVRVIGLGDCIQKNLPSPKGFRMSSGDRKLQRK